MLTQKEVHDIALLHGFHGHPERCEIGISIALIASEAFEALEAHRERKDEHVKEELADIILRTLDLSERLGFDVMAEAERKHKINLNREFKHGNKRY